ncbi:MAG TPA: hypothetical protein EYP90_09750, partial [Chromatiaceae bacterium]|nr:hypothetical protein [Chromatiaceae bacterium]
MMDFIRREPAAVMGNVEFEPQLWREPMLFHGVWRKFAASGGAGQSIDGVVRLGVGNAQLPSGNLVFRHRIFEPSGKRPGEMLPWQPVSFFHLLA